MRLPRARWGIVAGACLLLLAMPDRTVLGQEGDPVSQGNERTLQLRAELDKKLNQPVGANFNEVILRDAVVMIADEIEADVVFDRVAIEEETLSVDNPATLQLQHTQLPAREVLKLILALEGLEAVNQNGILMVTSASSAEEMLYLRVYDVRDLIEEAAKTVKIRPLPEYDCPECEENASLGNTTNQQASAEIVVPHRYQMMAWGTPSCGLSTCVDLFGGPREVATAILINSIVTTTPGPWYDVQGSGGTIRSFDGRLVVTQTEENHAQVQQILDGLRSGTDAAEEPAEISEPAAESLPQY